MKKLVLFFLACVCTLTASSQILNPDYLRYIEEWKDVALQNQKDYGIPASIIMAQALLESAAGKSELAVNAKNHFGIKCSGAWMGGVYYYDDDSKGECFRQYADAAESFRDHALFLQKPRYSTCFEIAIEDYEGWAYRLRECGYATDKLYAPKLIKLIEDYRLDALQPGGTRSSSRGQASSGPSAQRNQTKAAVVHQSEPIRTIQSDPVAPYVEPLTAKQERDSFFLMHPKHRFNGINYVNAREDDTYANMAFRLNVRERDLREWNDALGMDMKKGDRIYLAQKKNTGIADRPYVWTSAGMTLWQLSQEEGITIHAIQKLNDLDPQIRVFTFRQKIYLRKVKDDNAIR